MEAEKDIIDFIQNGQLTLGPVSFAFVREATRRTADQPDLIVKASWGGSETLLVAEVKRYGSDKAVMEAASVAQYYADRMSMKPLVIVPSLSEEQLHSLEKRQISGVDLCGNGVLVIPGLSVFRAGTPNRFPASRPLKRVYEGTSSLVARIFLLRPEFKSVSQIKDEVLARGGNITLSTVSKALKQLEEDAIVSKSKDGIRLLQADKLLDRLKTNYRPPKIGEVVRCEIVAESDLSQMMNREAKQAKAKFVLSGSSSVNYYASLGREPFDIYFCTSIPLQQLDRLGAKLDVESRFPNIEFQSTNAEYVYFDARNDKSGRLIASPIQTYLELATSDKRGQEVARQIGADLLAKLPSMQRRACPESS
jgi:hypothetical protein